MFSLVQDAFWTRTYCITSRDCSSSNSQPRKTILADCCTRGGHSFVSRVSWSRNSKTTLTKTSQAYLILCPTVIMEL
uniref:Uncharacterized protein n=1 Tax=Caenorhabditis japonica TaxID=281687 RepID=A0A8R1IHE1_CAEJA